MVLVPASLGIWLRRCTDKWADRAEKCGALGGGLLIAASIVAGLVSNFKVLSDATLFPWKNVVSVFLVAPIGMIFALAALLTLQYAQQQGYCFPGKGDAREKTVPLPVIATIVIETGVQNTVLAMAIATLSLSAAIEATEYLRVQLLIMFWGVVVSFEASCVMLICRYLTGREGSRTPSSSVEKYQEPNLPEVIENK